MRDKPSFNTNFFDEKPKTKTKNQKKIEKKLKNDNVKLLQRSLLVSGGFGKEGFYEGIKMKDYLVKNNVPDSCIIVDNKGNNTLATVENTLRLKDSLNFKSIIVVSQYFHLTRTKMLFKKLHFENVSSVSPKYFEIRDLYAMTIEFFAYYIE